MEDRQATSTILVPLDGSPMAERAVPYAQRLVPDGSALVLLRVVRGPEDFEGWWVIPTSDEYALDAAKESAQRYLTSVADRIRADVPDVRVHVAVGDPAEEIIELAEKMAVESIVMTTHGRGTAGRVFFGSVADRVARHGTRPTLLLRGEEGDDATDQEIAAPDRIIVALDGSATAETALPVAARFAKNLSVPVHLVRVVDLSTVIDEIWISRDRDEFTMPRDQAYEESRARGEEAAAAYLDSVRARLSAEGVEVSYEVRTGTPAFVFLDILLPTDLMMLTTRGKGGMRRWMIGSLAEKLVRQASSPVLLVRSGEQEPDDG